MITLKSLKEEIEFLTPKTFNYFIEKGLNSKLNPKLTIAIILKQKNKEDLLKYHCFNNSKLETKNDIPFFHPDVPDGFSLFCNPLEYMQLMAFISKNKNKDRKKNINKNNSEILETEPEPIKRHFVCQICKIKFDNYKEHIESIQHEQNKLKYHNTFLKMKLTFRRIVNYNESKKNKNLTDSPSKDKNISVIELKDSEDKKDKITSINLEDTYNNGTTKDDSFKLINDENKDANKKIYKEEIIDLTEKNDNMDDNEVLNVLDSIHCNPNKNTCIIKKRKKNEQNKSFFHDNYIYDLQKITGKISFFNKLNNMNK
jgi:hypothetical protein